jgi:thiamine pyrophosphate-dependent acetolactate synthase large subunit-like protein
MLLLGSQTMLRPELTDQLISAISYLRIPVWLQGMCRGLMWKNSSLYIRSNRASAFAKTDCLIVCGVPFDFRSQYGLSVPFRTYVASINRNKADLKLNSDLKLWMSPSLSVHGDPCEFMIALAQQAKQQNLDIKQWEQWGLKLRLSDDKKDEANKVQAQLKTSSFINPLRLCFEIDKVLGDNSVLIGDGGDFVATASYIIRPRGPLRWLDPGVFGTLGVGAGFAMAAKLLNPNSEVWIIWGDGACGFSLIELDTFRRHKIPVIAVIGNDACWTQIHRDQITSLQDDVGCVLEYTHYDQVAQALGCEGFMIDSDSQIEPVLAKAKELYAQGKSVVINAKIGKTDFREGSLSA